MITRYIQKNKNGEWAISNTKTGKALRNANTQKEAIALAGAMKSTSEIMIKRANGWTAATGWDMQIAHTIKISEKPKKAKSTKTPTKATVKKTSQEKASPKKATVKKPLANKVSSENVEIMQTNKLSAVKGSKEVKLKDSSTKKPMSGLIGFFAGISIIGIIIGAVFLIAHFVL